MSVSLQPRRRRVDPLERLELAMHVSTLESRAEKSRSVLLSDAMAKSIAGYLRKLLED